MDGEEKNMKGATAFNDSVKRRHENRKKILLQVLPVKFVFYYFKQKFSEKVKSHYQMLINTYTIMVEKYT